MDSSLVNDGHEHQYTLTQTPEAVIVQCSVCGLQLDTGAPVVGVPKDAFLNEVDDGHEHNLQVVGQAMHYNSVDEKYLVFDVRYCDLCGYGDEQFTAEGDEHVADPA